MESAQTIRPEYASKVNDEDTLFGKISFRYFLVSSIKSAILFTIFTKVYYAADNFNIARGISIPVHFPWEIKYIPFLAWTSIVYESPVFVIAAFPFMVRNKIAFNKYVLQYVSCIFLCGIIFILIPTVQEYSPPIEYSSGWGVKKIAWLADQANGSYNCFPSLHVINVILQARWGSINKSLTVRTLFWAWAAAVSVSTLTMHAHYVADIAGAIVMVLAVEWISTKISKDSGGVFKKRRHAERATTSRG